MRISSQKIAMIALFFFATIIASHAQVDTGTLSGVVSDATGAVLKAASITVTNIGTNAVYTATTAANGTYSLGNLAPARYKVSITAPSFETYETQTQITVGGHTSLDARLTVGSGITTIEVSATSGVQVNTDSQEISEVISPEQISQLPSLTRNIYDFVALSGNISSGDRTSQGQDQNSSSRGVGFSINGQRSSGTEILLDGVENSEIFGAGIGIHVPVDSVSEYSVLTSNYEPQYGRASGGVVNVVTARGANSFHGSVSEFNRVAAYTANTVTNARQGLSKGGYTRNQPGFFISGPIVRDRLFFAASSEWLRVRSSAIESNYVPTPQLLAYAAPTTQAFLKQYGQTLNFASTVTNAEAGTPFPTVPASTPVFGLVNYKVPQDSGGGLPQNTYNFTLRADYTLTDKTQLFARYVGYHLDEPFGAASFSPYSQYDIGSRDSDFAVLGGATHTFAPSLIQKGDPPALPGWQQDFENSGSMFSRELPVLRQ